MESTPRLCERLIDVLSQHAHGVDRRQLKPLAWMMVGLLQAGVGLRRVIGTVGTLVTRHRR